MKRLTRREVRIEERVILSGIVLIALLIILATYGYLSGTWESGQ